MKTTQPKQQWYDKYQIKMNMRHGEGSCDEGEWN
jgi:hypothetical protein